MMRKLWVISLLFSVLLAACASTSSSNPGYGSPPATVPPTSGKTEEVKINNFAFDPATITVPVGTTVKWTNADSTDHTVTADDKSFDSGGLAQGKSFTFTFTKAGSFSYHCSFHSSMTAKVVVTQ